MDKADRARYKQLALDTIIASPVHSKEAKLAEALEKCVEELEQRNRCPICGDGDSPDWGLVTTVLDEAGLRMEAK